MDQDQHAAIGLDKMSNDLAIGDTYEDGSKWLDMTEDLFCCCSDVDCDVAEPALELRRESPDSP